MNTILGIKFREYGQIYYFLAGQCSPVIGDRVIVETEQGQGIGDVVLIRDTLPASILTPAKLVNNNGDEASANAASLESDAVQPLLITNTTTSVVVIPNGDITVADIPYASAVTAKMQALKPDNMVQDEMVPNKMVSDDEADIADNVHENQEHHQCCGQSHTGGQGCCHNGAEPDQEDLDGVLVACGDVDDFVTPSTTSEADTIHINSASQGGRMVSYDGSAGEHSSDTQEVEDTSQPLSFDDLRPILRIATEYDLDHATGNELLSREASNYCKECIEARELDMKLVDVEVFFDLSKFIFYFTAPSRIDFRELVKDLVKHYRTRIELRQIGVRHETQMIGAVGNCGMVCCCRRFLRKFAPVTIKMAKEQNLFLNPAKISGICGRLLCCLSYEQENYEEFHRRCPRLGKKYMTSKGPIKIMRANMFRNSLIGYSETGEELEIPLEEWQEMEVRRPDAAQHTQASQTTQAQQAPRANRKEGREKPEAKGMSPDAKGVNPEAKPVNSDANNVASSGNSVEATQTQATKKPVLGCTGACERCGECGPSGSRGKKSDALANVTSASSPEASDQDSQEDTVSPSQTSGDTGDKGDKDNKPLASRPIQANVHDAEQVMASLSGIHQAPSGVSEHGIPTTQAQHKAFIQSLAGMDGGPLCSLAKPEKPVTPAAIAAHVIGDVAAAAEVAAKQAPASIPMTERLIKSTDTSALKTSRGRRKRRRKPRDGSASTLGQQNDENTFDDTDMD